MKNVFLMIGCILVFFMGLNAGIILEGNCGLYHFSDDNFKEHFGEKASLFGFGIGYEFNHVALILSGEYMNRVGEDDQGAKGIDFQLIPVSLTARYLFSKGALQPFLGLGLSYNKYDDDVDAAMGLIAEAGGYFRLVKKLYFGALIKYNYLKFLPQGLEVKMRGISMEVGITFK